MGVDYTWLLNGVDLDAATFGLASATLWRPPISTRRTNIKIPGRHGTLGNGLPEFEEPTFTVGLATDQADQATLERAVNNLVTLLTQPELTLTRLSGATTASTKAELVSADLDAGFLYGSRSTPTAVLALPEVVFRDISDVAVVPAWTVDHPCLPLPHLAGSSGPIGDAIVRVKGPLTSIDVVDLNSRTGISWSGTLEAGRWLYLAPDLLQAWDAAASEQWTPSGVDVSGGMDWPAAGALQLWPALTGPGLDGWSQVAVSVAGAGRSSATELAIRAGRCYL